jgi:tungstate transport system substrate-binding protein
VIRLRLAAWALATGWLMLAAGCSRPAPPLRLVTTTTVEGSGLLEFLLPKYRADCHCDVQAVAFGTGQALSVLEHGDADLSLTHDPEREQQSIAAGRVQRYAKVMFNDFLIAGPAADPAKVRGSAGAVDAMRRIGESGATFTSRGDNSGTHSRELQFWKRAGIAPPRNRIETGQGMAATLRVASERQAYVLTDRGTFVQLGSSLNLVILLEGGDDLLNTYAVMIRAGLPSDRLAQASDLFQWLTDQAGRDAIEAFRANGQQAFHIWPKGAPRDHPADLPHAR